MRFLKLTIILSVFSLNLFAQQAAEDVDVLAAISESPDAIEYMMAVDAAKAKREANKKALALQGDAYLANLAEDVKDISYFRQRQRDAAGRQADYNDRVSNMAYGQMAPQIAYYQGMVLSNQARRQFQIDNSQGEYQLRMAKMQQNAAYNIQLAQYCKSLGFIALDVRECNTLPTAVLTAIKNQANVEQAYRDRVLRNGNQIITNLSNDSVAFYNAEWAENPWE